MLRNRERSLYLKRLTYIVHRILSRLAFHIVEALSFREEVASSEKPRETLPLCGHTMLQDWLNLYACNRHNELVFTTFTWYTCMHDLYLPKQCLLLMPESETVTTIIFFLWDRAEGCLHIHHKPILYASYVEETVLACSACSKRTIHYCWNVLVGELFESWGWGWRRRWGKGVYGVGLFVTLTCRCQSTAQLASS